MNRNRSNAASPSLIPYDESVMRDVTILHRAAAHLRHIGWLLAFLIGGILGIWTLTVVVRGNLRAVQELVISGTFLGGCVFAYFQLANAIARGSRIAIASCLFFVSTFLFIVVLRMISVRNSVGEMFVETIFLIAHLNLVKLLWQGLGASRRLRLWREPVVVYPTPTETCSMEAD